MPVGFSFTADATKIVSWLLEVEAAAEGGGGGGGGGGGEQRGEGGSERGSDVDALTAALAAEGGAARMALAIKVATVDVQQLAAEAGLGSRGEVPSLQATCAHWLHDTMCKEEQCSEWGARPLSGEQMRYAATDASACLRVLDVLQEDWGTDQADAESLHERLR